MLLYIKPAMLLILYPPFPAVAIVIGLSEATITVEEGASQDVCVRIISGSTAGRVFSISYVAVPLVAQS